MSDGLFANHRIRIKRDACKLIKRKLQGPGRILARKNTEIAPHDILGQYQQATGFTKVDLAKDLGIAAGEAGKYLQKTPGQTVYKGELLAIRKSMFNKSQVIVPTDGIFEGVDSKTGVATLKLIPREVALTAGVFGVVEEIDPDKGEITIKSMMTELYGIFGTGNEKEGFINIISGAADLVNASKITEANRGQILVGGALVMEETIKQALSVSASGIICGGLNMDNYIAMANHLNPAKRVGTEIGISVMVSEGFGLIPIGDDFFELLQKYNNKFAMIQGNMSRLLLPSDDPNSILSCRKVSIPTSEMVVAKPELSVSEIKVGLRARLINPPFMGAQGEIIEIDGAPTRLESGISTYLLTLNTRFRKIRVPYTNIEIIN